MKMKIEEILSGLEFGRRQTVGYMEIIPLLGEDITTFAPPSFRIGTSDYGKVGVENLDKDRPTIVPQGTGWVVKQKAQDHAVPSARIIEPGTGVEIGNAMCIQQSQGGLISGDEHPMLIMPTSLRQKALVLRNDTEYNRLWNDIDALNRSMGVQTGSGNLVYLVQQFEKELNEFVAEFEIVPRQRGAVILIAGRLMGVELAPSHEFWCKIWEPLIRVSYGSMALLAARKHQGEMPKDRAVLNVRGRSVKALQSALERAEEQDEVRTREILAQVTSIEMEYSDQADQRSNGHRVTTVAHENITGQIVESGRGVGAGYVAYATLCASL